MVLTDAERKERKRISSKKYRENNREKERERKKKYNQSEGGKESRKKYNDSKRNKELSKIRLIKYKQTSNGQKIFKKTCWKQRGLNMYNFEEVYTRYKDAIFCDICECVLDEEGNYNRSKKCMDHDHDNGEFRNIVCFYCNIHICK